MPRAWGGVGAGLGPGHWPSRAQPSLSPSPPRGNQTCHPSTHTKAALGDLAVIGARVWERQPPPLSASQGARPHWRSWRWECGMPHPHSQAPHAHSSRLPSMGLPPAPSSIWEDEPNRQQGGLPDPRAGALSLPISDLAPAWGLCTLTSCLPSQLRGHLLNSATPRSSRPPMMLTPPLPPPP